MHLLTHKVYALRQAGISAILCLTMVPSILFIVVMDLLINWQQRPGVLGMEILTHGWSHLVANFLGQLRSSFQTKTVLFSFLRWFSSPH